MAIYSPGRNPRATEWLIDQYKKILDIRANTPARELAAMGYTNGAHYPEGKQGWMEAGLPVEKAA
jgi:hypothetical protein